MRQVAILDLACPICVSWHLHSVHNTVIAFFYYYKISNAELDIVKFIKKGIHGNICVKYVISYLN